MMVKRKMKFCLGGAVWGWFYCVSVTGLRPNNKKKHATAVYIKCQNLKLKFEIHIHIYMYMYIHTKK